MHGEWNGQTRPCAAGGRGTWKKKTVSDAADAKSAGGIVLYAAFVRRPVLRFR
jgi:hypothetical protein